MAAVVSGRPLVLEPVSEFERMPQDLKGPDLRGRDVVNPVGNVVGRVDDLFVDAGTNEVKLVRLRMTGTHGRATREVLVPIEDIEVLSDQKVRVRPVPAGL